MIHLVTLDFPPDFDGGIASWAHDLARALAPDVVVHAKRTDSELDDPGFVVHRMRGRSWARLQASWVLGQVVPRVAEGDAVLFATWPLAELAAPVLALREIPYAIAFHGSDLTRREPPPATLLDRAAALLPVSAYLGGLLARPHTVLPMPVSVGEGTQGDRGLLVVARLNRLKGVDRALRLAAALDLPITVAGEGPARQALEALAAELGVRATFTGRLARPAALDLCSGHTAAVLLSRADETGRGQEGLGLALLEAMGRGVPSIGSRCGGVPEIAQLVLDDPDDPVGAAVQVREWLGTRPERDARAWVADHHGPDRAASTVRRALA